MASRALNAITAPTSSGTTAASISPSPVPTSRAASTNGFSAPQAVCAGAPHCHTTWSMAACPNTPTSITVSDSPSSRAPKSYSQPDTLLCRGSRGCIHVTRLISRKGSRSSHIARPAPPIVSRFQS